MSSKRFLSMTPKELKAEGVVRPDVILVSGDAYIDSAYSGVAVIGRVLEAAGYSVGIIAQPDVSEDKDICALGEPRLFWGVSSGCVDSEIANYTALGKPRRSCDFTPGGINNRRPHRACIAYVNLIRRYFKNTVPLVLGGIEASLRRVAHYDQRTDKIRKSILPDSKADILVYGMGEKSVLEIADRLKHKKSLDNIPGTCVMSASAPPEYLGLPDFDQVERDPRAFAAMFKTFYQNSLGPCGKGMVQKYGDRFLVHHSPSSLPGRQELDRIYELPFLNDAHPLCRSMGHIRALETIKDSITTHRGCYGECSFCSIAVHQGRSVISRSVESIVREAGKLSQSEGFAGVIRDVGGPTANMYGSGCKNMSLGRPCLDRHCTGFEGVCSRLVPGHNKQKRLLEKISALPGIKQVNIASGIRYDLILADDIHGPGYLEQAIKHHIPGQMKIAPEHCADHILELMNKPGSADVLEFARRYRRLAEKLKKDVYLSCYVIAAHPGCGLRDMRRFADFARWNLRFSPEQVQIFTPAPSTRSTVMYHCGMDPFTGKKVWTEKSVTGRKQQKDAVRGRAADKTRTGGSRKKRFSPGKTSKPPKNKQRH
ncbi:MAG: YgiQ family radical SAM protein [Desulfonatronovibrio sp.]